MFGVMVGFEVFIGLCLGFWFGIRVLYLGLFFGVLIHIQVRFIFGVVFVLIFWFILVSMLRLCLIIFLIMERFGFCIWCSVFGDWVCGLGLTLLLDLVMDFWVCMFSLDLYFGLGLLLDLGMGFGCLGWICNFVLFYTRILRICFMFYVFLLRINVYVLILI